MSLTDIFSAENAMDIGMKLVEQDWNKRAAAEARQASERSSEMQMGFQERMSSTAYQRATADMAAAGLNPMLAYSQGGAHSPSGSAFQAQPAKTAVFNNIPQNVATSAQVDNITAQTEKARAETKEIEARTPTHSVSIDAMQQQIERSRAEIVKILQEATTSAASAANLEQQTRNLKAVLPNIHATLEQLRAQTKLTGAQSGLTAAQSNEITQRVKQNLPQIERAIRELEEKARFLEMPRRGMDAAANDSFLGALGAVLRTLNPLSGILSTTR